MRDKVLERKTLPEISFFAVLDRQILDDQLVHNDGMPFLNHLCKTLFDGQGLRIFDIGKAYRSDSIPSAPGKMFVIQVSP